MVTVKIFNQNGELVEVTQPKIFKQDKEWQLQLTPKQFAIARGKGTERAFCGNLLDNKKQGIYACVCCRLPLFSSGHKFDSGSGWPSFFQPAASENVIELPDDSLGVRRMEILCARCDAHLGHVFEDGPRPTGLRFCVNSESLQFVSIDDVKSLAEK